MASMKDDKIYFGGGSSPIKVGIKLEDNDIKVDSANIKTDGVEDGKILASNGEGGTKWVPDGGGAVDSVNGKTGVVVLDKTDIGLGNVDNTSDVNKPVSTATQNALNAKQDTLVSGTNIKTVNNQSILGDGNIDIGGGSGAVDSVNGKTGEVVLSKADILADMDTTAQIYCIQFNTTGSKPTVNSGLYAQGSLHYKHDILTTSQLRALLKQGDIKFIIPFNSSGYGLSEIYVDKGVGKTTEDCVFYVIEEISINRIKYFKFVMPASTTVGLTRVYYYDTGELGGSSVVANPTLSGTEEYITGIKIDNIPYQITDLQPKYLIHFCGHISHYTIVFLLI